MAAESGYRLRVPDTVADLVRSLHPLLKVRIKAAFKMIIDEPYCGKPLKAELEGLRSLRVKRFRIIYRLSIEKQIEIVAIGPRKTIYEETSRIIKRESDS